MSKKKLQSQFVSLAALAFLGWSQTALSAPPKEYNGPVELTSVTTGGPGCPAGSVQVVLAPDASVFTVLYDQFSLSHAPGSPNGVLECEVILNLHKPVALGLSVDSTDFRGFVSLEDGVQAEQQVQVLSGTGMIVRRVTAEFGSQIWKGPLTQEYLLTAVKSRRTPEILDCVPPKENTRVILKSRLQITATNPASSGQLSVDSADGKLAQTFHLGWHSCKQGGGRK